MSGKRMSEADLARARDLLAQGVSYYKMSGIIGFRAESIRRHLDPNFADRKRMQPPRYGRNISPFIHIASKNNIQSDAAARLAEIPDDTRDLTARICGDPLPGRSALDKRRMSQ